MARKVKEVKAKRKLRRGAVALSLGISLASAATGGYLEIDGKDAEAIGVVGQYRLGEAHIQPMLFKDKADFIRSINLMMLKPSNSKIRRLHFSCSDGSKGFTVYTTILGVFGIPDKDVVCDDGFKLVTYTGTEGREG